ncbi:hypothetical protein GII30_15045 [Gordonia amarae]|uniref:Uncharacterized protein n=2 Tax=Gordonia amarae TaxID=36821 RepID=G7GJV7_9ACTN|nr:hypothetical protein [Gordonia amarae]MCS3879721.1 hypothetical protein [Gordonia amarae]QHN18159.1 hypothetical protein GII35_15360 [Gordonia amarae]QHN31546.1 hypothetical protein GII32_15210 [Gordonia amarae]QHN40290.1 hypothetical protein GII30_15045 [Gordonia amarae]GAB03882.1 hypothetical protein GOAMR_06_00880 [Gordonia amarae NBRC 15530]
MTAPQQIEINMTSGASEVVRLVAVILFFAGVGALAWSVADSGYAELAGTGVAVMIVQIAKMLWAKGAITAPAKDPGADAFTETKGMLARVAGEYRAWMTGAGMLRIVVLAFAYAVAFLVLRAGMISALTVFKNLYIAAGCAALIGAFIVMPNFLKAYVDPLKKRGVINPDALKAQTSVPAPVVAPQPASVAQSQPAPVKKVVRRVIKKGNPDA